VTELLPQLAERLADELRRQRCRVVHVPGKPAADGQVCKRCELLTEYDAFRAIVQVPRTEKEGA
jgi:hypothetical protein